MRLELVFHPDVESDLAAIYAHYEQFDPSLPGRFEARLDEQVARLVAFPASGAPLFEVYRRVLLRRFPHMAVYTLRERRIEVLAVIDVRRDPAWIQATLTGRGE